MNGVIWQTVMCLAIAGVATLWLWHAVAEDAPPKHVRFCGRTYGIKARDVQCNDPSVDDISPLRHLTKLQRLSLSHSGVISLRPLEGLHELEELHINWTQVSDLGPLSGLKQLRLLNASFTLIKHLDPLQGSRMLEHLFLLDTLVADLSAVQHLINDGLVVIGP